MKDDILAPIYDSINWNGPEPRRCYKCQDISPGRLTAGSYPSSLSHYEAILGSLPEPRTAARILLVLQDPRSDENHFKVANPAKAPSALEPNEHHYFCLTPVAWRELKLDSATRSAKPIWPTAETAPHFLHRYLSKKNRAWSYDGFLAYFLYLLKPQAAVITNLAKCHFSSSPNSRVYNRCASIHLRSEASLLQPNLLLSFTSQCSQERLHKTIPSLTSVTRLDLRHPAARRGWDEKSQHFLDEMGRNIKALEKLGFDVPTLQAQWKHDAIRAKSLD